MRNFIKCLNMVKVTTRAPLNIHYTYYSEAVLWYMMHETTITTITIIKNVLK